MAVDATHAPAHQPKAKIFISYSRRDIAFADRVDGALKARGFEPLIDRTEIYAFEDWWRRIEDLIVRADTIVFVLSPDAVVSEVCAKEVAFATSLNKRFAPIVRAPVDAATVPEALRRLNFVFFTEEAHFEENADRLAEALSTDVEWIRKHTDFGQLAWRWAGAGRPGPRGLLLRSPTLDEAERWIAARPHGAPPPTSDTQDFIIESRKAATRRRNILSASLAAGLAVALGLTGLAYWMLRVSENRRNDALIAQSRFLTRDSRQATDSGDAVLGELLALEALPRDLSNPDRPFLNEAAFALEHAYANRRERLLMPDVGFANAPSFSSDGTLILLGGPSIFDAGTGKTIFSAERDKESFHDTRILPGNTRLVTTTYGDHATTTVWNIRTGQKIVSWPRTVGDQDPLFSPDGTRAITNAESENVLRLWDVVSGREIATLGGALDAKASYNSPQHQCVFSPDGRRIVTSFYDRGLQLWDADTGAALATLRNRGGYAPAFSPDGRHLMFRDSDVVRIVDAATGQEPFGPLRSEGDWLDDAKYSRDGAIVIIITQDHDDRRAAVQLWDAASGRQISVMRGHAKQIFAADLSADGSRLASAADDGTIRLWDAATGAQLTELRAGVGSTKRPRFAFSPDGSRLLAMFYDRHDDIAAIRLVDAESGTELPAPEGQISSTRTAFSPDSRLLLTVAGRAARLWDLKTGAPVLTLVGHRQNVTGAAFSPDGSRLLTTGVEQSLAVWTIEPAAMLRAFRGHAGAIGTAAVSPDGTRLLTSSADKTARLWRLDTGEALLTLHGHDEAVTDAEFSPDGRRIVTASADKTARVWDAATGRAVLTLAGHQDKVNSAAFSPDGTRIVTASSDKTARVWDAITGRTLFVIEQPARVLSAVYSPDGKQIVISAIELRDGVSARVFSASDGKPLKELRMFVDNPRFGPDWNAIMQKEEHIARARAFLTTRAKRSTATYSPDGKRIATATYGWLVQLWDSDTGLKTGNIPQDGSAWSLGYSPDATRVIVASNDGVARTFTAADEVAGSGGPIATFGAHLGAVHAATYTPDDAHVVTGSEDGIARLWDAPRCQALIDAARRDIPRNFSDAERLDYFVTETRPDREARIFAVIRNTLSFLLPRAGSTCS